MTFKKIIPSYLLCLVFAVLGPIYVFIYAYDFFMTLGEDAKLNSGLYLLVILVAFALGAYFLHQFSKILYKKRPHKEQHLYKVWTRVALVLTVILIFCGGCWCVYLAENAPTSETILFRLIHIPDAAFDDYRSELYVVLMRTLMGIFGNSVEKALLIQAGLYIGSVLLLSLSVRILAGRLSAMLGVIFMLFVPIFTVTVKSINSDVMFWVMLSTALFAAALFSSFAVDDESEFSIVLKILVSVFAGFLSGMLIGWDFGLVFILLIPIFSFFRSRVKPLRFLPQFLVYLVLCTVGFLVSTGGGFSGVLSFVSQIRVELPLPVMTHTMMYFVISSLSLVSIFAFFAGRYFERVVMWMLITLYAMYIANQVTLSGVSLPGFAILMMLILTGDSVSALMISAAREKALAELLARIEEEEKQASRKRLTGGLIKKVKNDNQEKDSNDDEDDDQPNRQTDDMRVAEEEVPAPVVAPEPAVTPVPAVAPEPVVAPVSVVAPAPAVATVSTVAPEATEVSEISSNEAPTATIEELGGEELYIPNGMVLPMDDETADSEPREVPLPMPEIGKLSLDRSGRKPETLEEEETRQEDEALLEDVGATIAVNHMIEEVGGEAAAIKIIEAYNAEQAGATVENVEAVTNAEAVLPSSPVEPAPDRAPVQPAVTSVEEVAPVAPSAVVDENGEVYQFYRSAESAPVAPSPVSVAPAPVAPSPVSVAPAPVPVAPAPVAPAPAPVAPAPAPVAPAPAPAAPAPNAGFDFDLPLVAGDDFDI